jgi:LCP family protein required for cell wall assembly
VVSFPRDLIVDIPGHGRRQLNAAIGIGGAPLLIQTLSTDFHFPIQHFLQVDFTSFPQIVDAIGHVNAWFSTPAHDPYIGLNIEHAGCVSLDGPAALAYARSRHYYVPDDRTHPAPWQWNYDPKLPEDAYRGGSGWTALGSDIDRIPRQQYFLRTLAQTAIKRTNDDPVRIIGLVDAVMTHLTTDQTLTLDELKALVRTFRRLRPADIEMTTLPWSPDGDRVVVKYPEAASLLFRLGEFAASGPFLPPLQDPRTVRVRVVDGSGVPGLGARALQQLVAAGFRSVGPAVDVDQRYARSQVRWTDAGSVPGVTVTYATGAHVSGEATRAADLGGADVLVVVGSDWNTLQHHLGRLGRRNGTAGSTPERTPATTISAPTTTTPRPKVDRGFEPVDPKTGGVLVGCPKS